jgi:hypothetical protein
VSSVVVVELLLLIHGQVGDAYGSKNIGLVVGGLTTCKQPANMEVFKTDIRLLQQDQVSVSQDHVLRCALRG